jgi:hypothetical protein
MTSGFDWRARLARLKPPQPVAGAGDTLPERTLWHLVMPPVGPLPQGPAPTGQRLGDGLTLHHDAGAGTGPLSGAADGRLTLDCTGMSGAFVSLAFALPDSIARSLTRDDILRFDADFAVQGEPAVTFARLNLVSGPNTDAYPLELAADDGPRRTEWDLSFTEFEPGRARAAWIDLIFERPGGRRITVTALSALAYPRAHFL